MAVRKNEPLHGGFAAIVALTLFPAAPLLAAPDRNICDDAAAATLEVSSTELSRATPADADDTVELLGPGFEFASREPGAVDEEAPEKTERAVDEADNDQDDTSIPADSGPLVNKRQMYRRDI